MAVERDDFRPGHRLGIYEIRRCLGRGGMGAVYLARDHSLDRKVAIKVLHPSRSGDDSLVRRFEREAKAAARLSHPNIVSVYAVGSEKGLPYIVMEYVDGIPLDQWMAREGAMDWRRAMTLCGQVASALHCAHTKGVVHRDIKPANILMDRENRARVTDFGVAKVLEASTQLTTEGTFIGTPQYMSPEQCGIGEIGPQSDIFSLGITVYELLAGVRPFDASTPAGLVRAITSDVQVPLTERVPNLPVPVGQVVEAMLAKEPWRRYASASEVLSDLRRLSQGRSPLHAVTQLELKAEVLPPSTSTRKGDGTAKVRKHRIFTRRRVIIAALVFLGLLVVADKDKAKGKAGTDPRPAPVSREEPSAAPRPADQATGRPSPFAPPTTVKPTPRAGETRLSGMGGARLRDIFRQADRDGDGALSYDELRALPDVQLRTRLRRADTNGDRQLTVPELQVFFRDTIGWRPRTRGRLEPAR